jgi:DNA polymerase-3 subunit alpha
MEKEVLGLYVSSHPLASFAQKLKTFGNAKVSSLPNTADGSIVTIGGMISAVRVKNDMKDRRYAQVVLEDLEGSVRVMVFSKQFEEFKDMLVVDKIVFINGKLDRSRDEPTLICNEIIPEKEALGRLTGKAIISLQAHELSEDNLRQLQDIVRANAGGIPLVFSVNTMSHHRVTITAGRGFSIQPSDDFSAQVRNLLGEGHLHYAS